MLHFLHEQVSRAQLDSTILINETRHYTLFMFSLRHGICLVSYDRIKALAKCHSSRRRVNEERRRRMIDASKIHFEPLFSKFSSKRTSSWMSMQIILLNSYHGRKGLNVKSVAAWTSHQFHSNQFVAWPNIYKHLYPCSRVMDSSQFVQVPV